VKTGNFIINERGRGSGGEPTIPAPLTARAEIGRENRTETVTRNTTMNNPQSAKASRNFLQEPSSSGVNVRENVPINNSYDGISMPVTERQLHSGRVVGAALQSERKPTGHHKSSKSENIQKRQFGTFELKNPEKVAIPKFDKTKTIVRKLGHIAGFCVNTNKGNTRNYNEDRVSVLLNAQQK